jgi:hypothetical protein
VDVELSTVIGRSRARLGGRREPGAPLRHLMLRVLRYHSGLVRHFQILGHGVVPSAGRWACYRLSASTCPNGRRVADLGLFPIRLAISWTLFARAFASQRLLHSLLLTGFQIEGVPLDLFDYVLLEDFSLEALERALQALAIMKLNFSQRKSPQFQSVSTLQRNNAPAGHSGASRHSGG